jgi:hypothetical protein
MSDSQNSHLESLFEGDTYRKKTMIEANIYPIFMILNFDLNLQSTIHKAILLKAVKSLKILIDMVFDNLNKMEYRDMIMFDLSLLLRDD